MSFCKCHLLTCERMYVCGSIRKKKKKYQQKHRTSNLGIDGAVLIYQQEK